MSAFKRSRSSAAARLACKASTSAFKRPRSSLSSAWPTFCSISGTSRRSSFTSCKACLLASCGSLSVRTFKDEISPLTSSMKLLCSSLSSSAVSACPCSDLSPPPSDFFSSRSTSLLSFSNPPSSSESAVDSLRSSCCKLSVSDPCLARQTSRRCCRPLTSFPRSCAGWGTKPLNPCFKPSTSASTPFTIVCWLSDASVIFLNSSSSACACFCQACSE
mmetsp:Transcript_45708/g.105599  ORF Transcript_45708/g.105599 Transcript_45708/m.105599 type:complete len:218 (-) Transcript_45708:810-1463(-)